MFHQSYDTAKARPTTDNRFYMTEGSQTFVGMSLVKEVKCRLTHKTMVVTGKLNGKYVVHFPSALGLKDINDVIHYLNGVNINAA